MDQLRRTTPAIANEFRRSTLAGGEILLSIRGHVGRTAIVPKSLAGANITQDTARLDLNEKCFPRFVFWCFHSPDTQRWMDRHTKGVAVTGINIGDVRQIPIPLPPLADQKRIAAILDKADAIGRRCREAVVLAEEFLPSIFTDLFGPAGSKCNSESLDNHLHFLTSGSRGWARHYVASGKRFIRSLDVQMNRIGADDVAFVDPPLGTEADRTRVKDSDLLITITGSRIGRVAFVPDGFGEAYVSQHVAIVRLKPTLRPRYCSLFMSLPNGGPEANRES